MPKVQNVIAPAPAPNSASPKPAKDTQTPCGVNEFKRRLADARKKDDAPADPPKAEQSAKTKRAKAEGSANTKQGDAEAVDAPTDEMTGAGDVVAAPATEEIVDEQPIAEHPAGEQATVGAKTEEAPTPAMMIAAVPAQTAEIVEDEPIVTTAEVEQGEDVELPGVARPVQNVPMKAAGESTDPDADDAAARVMPTVATDDVASDEDMAGERIEPEAPTKHVTKPTPTAAAPIAEMEGKPKAQPKSVPAALESLEQTVAAFDASQPEPASSMTPKAADATTQTSVSPAPSSASERTVTAPQAASAPAPAPAPVTVHSFAEVNHPKIVTSIRGELLPTGGTMQIRLDPPELGALQVLVHMRDGAMTASFQTSNDDATKLLSHSLGQLKQVLESQGVSVDKLHVQQAPRDQQMSNDQQREQQHAREDETARHEQQRKEMLRRMWRRLSGNSDPLDLVA